jgi:hypothetical protein
MIRYFAISVTLKHLKSETASGRMAPSSICADEAESDLSYRADKASGTPHLPIAVRETNHQKFVRLLEIACNAVSN